MSRPAPSGLLARLIAWSARQRVLVCMVTILLAVVGLEALRRTPVDAIPDLSDVQVIVTADWPGQDPQTVQDQVAWPLSTALLAVPQARTVRTMATPGQASAQVLFSDDTDVYEARSRVLEVMASAGGELPEGVRLRLGPDASGVGWIYVLTLSDLSPEAAALRRVLDTDHSGAVSRDELAGLSGTLAELLGRGRPSWADAAWAEEGAEALAASFDADGDRVLGGAELLAAANFRGTDLAALRTLLDTVVGPELTALEGVSEVASVGGFVRRFEVEADPERMRAFGVSMDQLRAALRDASSATGAGTLELAETEHLLRATAWATRLEDLELTPVAASHETHSAVLLRQVARVSEGPAPRRGLVELDGRGEVVSGIVVMRHGGNARQVIQRVEDRLAELGPSLPPGVRLVESYDRSGLIDRAVAALTEKLALELLVVALVCLAFLLHLRSALVALVTVPLGVLLAFIPMRALGLGADIMSLGGIAIAMGVMVDASVVMVENLHKHRERDPEAPHLDLVIRAAQEVGPALFVSLAVVTVSFLPVFALESQEGRLFGPLAWTKTLAMAAATLLSVTLIPALMALLVRGHLRSEAANPLSRLAMAAYRPVLALALRVPRLTLLLALVASCSVVPMARDLGSEFLPPLDEGDLMYMPTTPPGLSITKARELLQQTDALIAAHPQVESVLGKIGRADTATDPAPLTMIETHIRLTPEHTWPEGQTTEGIVRELDARVQLPGLTNGWTKPIRARIDMLATGIRTPVGVKLMGADLDELSATGRQIEAVLSELPETRSVFAERATGAHYLDLEVDKEDAARFGLGVGDVHRAFRTAVGGEVVGATVRGLERIPLVLRYPPSLRQELSALERVAVDTPMGHPVALGQLATLRASTGPPAIKSENARPTSWVFVEPDTRDLGGYVQAARAAVAEQVRLPPGVTLRWSGQVESLERVEERLRTVVPLTIGIIVVLIYAHLRRGMETLVVLGTLPVAAIGSFAALWLTETPLSVAVVVGLLALAGLAAETGLVMLVYLDEALARWEDEGLLDGPSGLEGAITEGALERLRPKLMTVATTGIGLLPVVLGGGTGAQVMSRIALPMVGGLATSAALTLVVIPAAVLTWQRWLRSAAPDPEPEPEPESG